MEIFFQGDETYAVLIFSCATTRGEILLKIRWSVSCTVSRSCYQPCKLFSYFTHPKFQTNTHEVKNDVYSKNKMCTVGFYFVRQ